MGKIVCEAAGGKLVAYKEDLDTYIFMYNYVFLTNSPIFIIFLFNSVYKKLSNQILRLKK